MIHLIRLLLAAALVTDSSPVRRVDHIVVAATDPAALFAFFSDTLRLPVAWGLQSFGPYRSGGVSVGDINIEIGGGVARPGAPLPRIASIVFEPVPLARAMSTLRERGLVLGPAVPFGLEPNAPPELPGWTTVTVRTLTSAPLNVVLCEYVRPNASVFRAAMQDSLRAHDGGVLGILGASVLVIGTGGDSTHERDWRRFAADDPRDEDPQHEAVLGGGPRLRFDASRARGTVALVLRVRSLENARRALDALGVRTTRRETELALDSARLQGLEMVLTEP